MRVISTDLAMLYYCETECCNHRDHELEKQQCGEDTAGDVLVKTLVILKAMIVFLKPIVFNSDQI